MRLDVLVEANVLVRKLLMVWKRRKNDADFEKWS